MIVATFTYTRPRSVFTAPGPDEVQIVTVRGHADFGPNARQIIVLDEATPIGTTSVLNFTDDVEVPTNNPAMGRVDIPKATPPSQQSYAFTQASPSDTWTINHNLGRNPIVELRSTGGETIEASVIHTSVNQTVVSMNAPRAGTARLV